MSDSPATQDIRDLVNSQFALSVKIERRRSNSYRCSHCSDYDGFLGARLDQEWCQTVSFQSHGVTNDHSSFQKLVGCDEAL